MADPIQDKMTAAEEELIQTYAESEAALFWVRTLANCTIDELKHVIANPEKSDIAHEIAKDYLAAVLDTPRDE